MKIRRSRLELTITSADVYAGLWQLAFGWLSLFYRDKNNRNPVNIALPFGSNIAQTIVLIAIGLIGVAYFGFLAERPIVSQAALPAPKKTVQVPVNQAARGLARVEPKHLKIEAAGVDTDLIELGRMPDGTLETPTSYTLAGWYKYAPTPGEVGPAVIVGHVDNYKGPAVFYRLKELKPGDIIEVTRLNGSVVKFKVNSVEQFQQNNFPTQKVYGNINYPGLRLITCGGEFNRASGEYTANTVVFASKTD